MIRYYGKSYYSYRALKLLEPEEKRILRCLGYLTTLIYNSEKDGTHNLKPHSSLIEHDKITQLKVNNMCMNFLKDSIWPK